MEIKKIAMLSPYPHYLRISLGYIDELLSLALDTLKECLDPSLHLS